MHLRSTLAVAGLAFGVVFTGHASAQPAAPAAERMNPLLQHIWTLAYSAGYYSYLWSEVLDSDAYAWFKENGGMTRQNGQRFRDMVLSRGGTKEAAVLYREFRGRDATPDALLDERGLK